MVSYETIFQYEKKPSLDSEKVKVINIELIIPSETNFFGILQPDWGNNL